MLASCTTGETGGASLALDDEGAVLGRGAAGALVVAAVEWTAPEGADGAPRLALAWRGADGTLSPIALPSPAVDAEVWQGAAAVLTQEGALYRAEGAALEPIAQDVIGELGVSDDGARLAYVVEDGEALGTLHVKGESDVVIARGLQSAGRFRFTPEGQAILFVGAERGGVAGLWVAALDGSGARPLTNEGLRTGRPWNGAFVEPPAAAADLEIDGDTVRYMTSEGAVERTWRQR